MEPKTINEDKFPFANKGADSTLLAAIMTAYDPLRNGDADPKSVRHFYETMDAAYDTAISREQRERRTREARRHTTLLVIGKETIKECATRDAITYLMTLGVALTGHMLGIGALATFGCLMFAMFAVTTWAKRHAVKYEIEQSQGARLFSFLEGQLGAKPKK